MTEQLENGHYRLEDDVHFQDFCTNIWLRYLTEKSVKEETALDFDPFVELNIEFLKLSYLKLIKGETTL
tara:strand:+ start:100 stop:306 length:207 start_codon:yes stop_codon:yes gene_type:complete